MLTLQVHGDERGSLIALENNRDIPFRVKRVYYVFDTKAGVRRGFHAHKNLRQITIAVRGSCRFLLDDGHEKIELLLDHPTQALFIGPWVWHEMYDFSEDCVLLALADAYYQASDYIRDYAQFIKQVKDNDAKSTK